MRQFDPARPLNEPYGLECDRWVPSAMRRPDRHQEVEVNFAPQAELTYRIADRQVRVPKGRLALFRAAVPHQLVGWTSESPYWVLTVPFVEFLALGLPEALVERVLSGEMLWDARPAASSLDAERFERWGCWISGGQAGPARQALSELRSRLCELASSRPASSMESERLPSHSKVSRMALEVARRYREPLTVAEIAESVGLNPNYAMDLFRREFGTTLVRTLVQYRVAHAMRLLATTGLPIADVAEASGFCSSSRFNEAFRQTCGRSPREFRSECRGAGRADRR